MPCARAQRATSGVKIAEIARAIPKHVASRTGSPEDSNGTEMVALGSILGAQSHGGQLRLPAPHYTLIPGSPYTASKVQWSNSHACSLVLTGIQHALPESEHRPWAGDVDASRAVGRTADAPGACSLVQLNQRCPLPCYWNQGAHPSVTEHGTSYRSCGHGRRKSPSSDLDTPACQWPSSSRVPAFNVWAWTSISRESMRSRKAAVQSRMLTTPISRPCGPTHDWKPARIPRFWTTRTWPLFCVPTLLTSSGGPDLRFVETAGGTIAEHLHPGMLVVLQSTCGPGTTTGTLVPLLELVSNLHDGEDFYVVFAPERIDPAGTPDSMSRTRQSWSAARPPRRLGPAASSTARASTKSSR